MYDDDGRSLAYRNGAYVRMRFTCEVRDGELHVSAEREHAGFAPWWKAIRLVVHRADGTTQAQSLDR